MNTTNVTTWKFNLGDRVKDAVTKAAGVILIRSEYATGCRHYALENGKFKQDGQPQDYLWFDESRLVKTGHLDIPGATAEPTSGPNRQGEAPRLG